MSNSKKDTYIPPEIKEVAEDADVINAVSGELTEVKSETVMYLGPTINNVIKHSTVFENGILPPAVSSFAEKQPLINQLMIPLNKVSEAVKELNDSDSSLSAICNIIRNKY